jgi:F-type H+-transporting ATPase subunit b
MSLDINITYILVLALFLVPVLLLNGIVFRPFLKLFEERHEQLEGAVKRAEEMLDQAEDRARTFESKIQVATQKGIEARNRIRGDAANEMNARVEKERQALAKKTEQALAELDKKRREALADVMVEAERIAHQTASKLLGRGV